jgi:hypothetical protein
MAVYSYSFTDDWKFAGEKIENMMGTLKSVIGADDNQQLHVLFGLQALRADIQAVDVLGDMFRHCHKHKLVSGSVFSEWSNSSHPLRDIGKEMADKETKDFFDFLKTSSGDGGAT